MSTKKKRQDSERLKAQIEDIHGFAREFQSEGDRSTAILGAALLDEELRQLLTEFLVDDEDQVNLLITGDAPVATFSARSRVCYCLGLIPRTIFDMLTNIREVRNTFAHQLHGLAFADSRFVYMGLLAAACGFGSAEPGP
jgi:mannitol operon repressor